MEEAQKVSNASFSLKDIALVWWRRRCDDVREDPTPSALGMSSKGNSRSSSIPRMLNTKLGPSFIDFNIKMGEFGNMSRSSKSYSWKCRTCGSKRLILLPRWPKRLGHDGA